MIKVLEMRDPQSFETAVNHLLSEGWKILSTSCGFVNSKEYDFCSSYQAILFKE